MTQPAFIDVEGARIHYRVDGPSSVPKRGEDLAPVLLFSNHLGTELAMWAPQVAALGSRFRIVRYDNRGHGASSTSPGEYTIELLANDALAVLDHLGLERVGFCGISMGGAVGMWLALHVPKRVHKLALCCTAAQLGTAEVWNARIDTVRKNGMQAVAEAALQRWFTPPFHQREPAAVDRVRKMLLATSPEGYAACCAAVRDVEFRDAISRVHAPTLVISGAKDASIPPPYGRFLADRIRGAQLVELDAPHLANIQAPPRFTQKNPPFFPS